MYSYTCTLFLQTQISSISTAATIYPSSLASHKVGHTAVYCAYSYFRFLKIDRVELLYRSWPVPAKFKTVTGKWREGKKDNGEENISELQPSRNVPSTVHTTDVIWEITFIQCNFAECSAKSGWHGKCQRIATTRRVFTLPFVGFFPTWGPSITNTSPILPPTSAFILSPLLNLSLPSGLHFYSSHVDHTVSDSGWQLLTQSKDIFKAALPLKERRHLKYLSPCEEGEKTRISAICVLIFAFK